MNILALECEAIYEVDRLQIKVRIMEVRNYVYEKLLDFFEIYIYIRRFYNSKLHSFSFLNNNEYKKKKKCKTLMTSFKLETILPSQVGTEYNLLFLLSKKFFVDAIKNVSYNLQ